MGKLYLGKIGFRNLGKKYIVFFCLTGCLTKEINRCDNLFVNCLFVNCLSVDCFDDTKNNLFLNLLSFLVRKLVRKLDWKLVFKEKFSLYAAN